MPTGVNITKSTLCGGQGGINKLWYICADELDNSTAGQSAVTLDNSTYSCACVASFNLDASAPGSTPGFRYIQFEKDTAFFTNTANIPRAGAYNFTTTVQWDINRMNIETRCQLDCLFEYANCCSEGLIMIVKDNNAEYHVLGFYYYQSKAEYSFFGLTVGAGTQQQTGTVAATDINGYTVALTTTVPGLIPQYCGNEASIPVFAP